MRIPFRTLVAVPLLIVSGCGGDGTGPNRSDPDPVVTAVGTPTGPLSTATIGAAGGNLQSTDGRLRMTIPAGALSGDTPIGIQRISDLAPGGVGAYRFTPDGTTFATPVTIRVYYDTSMVEGTRPQFLTVATQLADGSWGILPDSNVTLQLVDAAIDFRTTHFSDYTMLQGLQIRPPTDTIDPGESVGLDVRNCANYEERNGSDYSGFVINCEDPDPDNPPLPRFRVDVASWAANGVRGGSAAVGFVAGEGTRAQYIAPQNPPAGNPVAVSVRVTNLSGQEAASLVANITIRNTCEAAPTIRGLLLRADCGYPLEMTGSSSTTINEANPLYTLDANMTWKYDSTLSIPGHTLWYKASGVATFDAINSCISITPSTFSWEVGHPTAGGDLVINLEDSTWTASGVALWTATYQDNCEEEPEPAEGGAGGGWLAAGGTLDSTFTFTGVESNGGQTFTYHWGPSGWTTLRMSRKR